MNKKENNNILKSIYDNKRVSIISIVAALLVSVLFVCYSTGENYFTSFGLLFSSIIEGSLSDLAGISETLMYATILLFTGVAHCIAFRTGIFNIGAEGQFIVGMLCATLVGLIKGIPMIIHVPLVIIAGLIAGFIWAFVPGYLKAKKGINEVVISIMMNFIAMYLSNYVVMNLFKAEGQNATNDIQESARLFRFLGPSNRVDISIFLAIIVSILAYILLNKTKDGYELRAVGSSSSAAEYGGINIHKNIILAMTISGAIAGIGGASYVSGIQFQMISLTTFPNFGFNGLTVALIAKSNPLAAILSALLIGVLNSSQLFLQLNGIPKEIISLIQAVIILFIAAEFAFKMLRRKGRK